MSVRRHVVSFGPYEADLDSAELRKRGRKIRIQGKPFAVLSALLERPGEVVTRADLQEKLWPDDTVVAFDDNLNTAVGKLRAALGDSARRARFIETLPRRGYRFLSSTSEHRDSDVVTESPTVPCIAVLPLENLSGDPEQEYFADGMTDAILTDLAKLEALSVISRTSIMQYKGVRKSLREIAEELGVDLILEGTVCRSGERVRITAQLLDAQKDRHLWGESFDRDLSDVLTVQSEIARAIATQIRVQLSAEEEARLSRTRKIDTAAHEAYLKGRYCLNQRTERELEKSIRYFEQAAERDSSYAVAYSGLCDAYTLLVAGGFGARTPAELFPKAKDAALRALALDDTLADAHASLGFLRFKMEWDWNGAERAFRTAIELNPSSVTAHHWYALYLMSMVRLDEALSEIRRAHELDPLSPILKCAVGRVLHLAGRYELAIEHFRAVLAFDPKFSQAHFDLGSTYLEMKRFQQAIVEFETALSLSGTRPTTLKRIGIAHARWGNETKAREILRKLKRLALRRYVSPYDFAELHLALGELDETFRRLEQGFREHDAFMIYLDVDPVLRGARSDPRFAALARRMRFPAWRA